MERWCEGRCASRGVGSGGCGLFGERDCGGRIGEVSLAEGNAWRGRSVARRLVGGLVLRLARPWLVMTVSVVGEKIVVWS